MESLAKIIDNLEKAKRCREDAIPYATSEELKQKRMAQYRQACNDYYEAERYWGWLFDRSNGQRPIMYAEDHIRIVRDTIYIFQSLKALQSKI